MSTAPAEVLGPVDYVLLEFPQGRFTGEARDALRNIVDSGVIRLYDLTVISKDPDGAVTVLDLTQATPDTGGFDLFAGARSHLLDDDDLRQAADALEPNTVAVLIVYENTWAVPFVAAARRSGGELIASARIPAADLVAALDSTIT